MNFAPHHAFAACTRLETTLERIRVAGLVSPQVFSDYAKYHFSLVHKCRSAKYHVETLDSYLSNQNAQQLDPYSVVYRVNFHFDGFLQSLGSALDILAREALVYFGIAHPANVYYWTARQQIGVARPGDPILALLNDPPWKQEFSEYRNTAVHESIVGTNFQVNMRVEGRQTITKLVFPIPDDPRLLPATYRNNPDIVHYCRVTFRRVLSHTNQLYTHLEQRVRAHNALPL